MKHINSKIMVTLSIVMMSLMLVPYYTSLQGKVYGNIIDAPIRRAIHIPRELAIPSQRFQEFIEEGQQLDIYFIKSVDDVNYISVRDLSEDVGSFLGRRIPVGTQSITNYEVSKPHNLVVKQFGSLGEDDMNITFKKLDADLLGDSVAGSFSVYAFDEVLFDIFINRVAHRIGMDVDSLVLNMKVHYDITNQTKIIIVLLVIFAISSIVTTSASQAKRSKEISVQKLLGNSDFQIAVDGWKGYLIYSGVLIVISFGIATSYFRSFDWYYALHHFIFTGTSVVSIALSAILTTQYILRGSSITQYIKKRSVSKQFMQVSIFTKAVFIVLVFLITLQSVQSFQVGVEVKERLRKFMLFDEYHAFSTYSKDEFVETSDLRIPGYPAFEAKEFYKKIVATNESVYADFASYTNCREQDSNIKQLCDDRYLFALVSDTYLSQYETVETDLFMPMINEGQRVILIPKSLQNQMSNIKESYIERYEPKGSEVEVSFVIYDSESFFGINSDIPSNDFLIVDPIMIVINEHNLGEITTWSFSFFGYGNGNGFKFKIDPTEGVDGWYGRNVQALSEMGLDDNLKTNHIESSYKDLQTDVLGNSLMIRVSVIVLIAAGIVLSIIISNAAYVYFEESRDEIIVRKFLGGSNWSAFKGYYLVMVLSDVIPLLFLVTWLRVESNGLLTREGLIVFLILVSILEIGLFSIRKMRFSKKTLSSQLKGEA